MPTNKRPNGAGRQVRQLAGPRRVIAVTAGAPARGTEMVLPLWLRLFGAVGSPSSSIKVVR